MQIEYNVWVGGCGCRAIPVTTCWPHHHDMPPSCHRCGDWMTMLEIWQIIRIIRLCILNNSRKWMLHLQRFINTKRLEVPFSFESGKHKERNSFGAWSRIKPRSLWEWRFRISSTIYPKPWADVHHFILGFQAGNATTMEQETNTGGIQPDHARTTGRQGCLPSTSKPSRDRNYESSDETQNLTRSTK